MSLAAFIAQRPANGTIEFERFITRFLRTTMEKYSFDVQLYDWAHQRNYLLPTLHFWNEQLPYFVPRGGGVIMNSQIAPHDLEGITVGDLMIFPVLFNEPHERGGERSSFALEPLVQFNRRFDVMLLVARVFREPFLFDVDNKSGCSSAVASRAIITEQPFSVVNLISNEPLYYKCKQLICRAIARDIEKAPQTDDEEDDEEMCILIEGLTSGPYGGIGLYVQTREYTHTSDTKQTTCSRIYAP